MDIEAADMTLLSEDKRSRISFLVLEAETEHYLSANLLVEVTDDEFCGWDAVWFGADVWNAFAEQLKQCEPTRRGSAILSGMSPDDFGIQIESCDSLGHFIARYKLTRTRIGAFSDTDRTLTGSFELDASCFAQMLRDFAALARRLAPEE